MLAVNIIMPYQPAKVRLFLYFCIVPNTKTTTNINTGTIHR